MEKEIYNLTYETRDEDGPEGGAAVVNSAAATGYFLVVFEEGSNITSSQGWISMMGLARALVAAYGEQMDDLLSKIELVRKIGLGENPLAQLMEKILSGGMPN